VKAQQFIGTAAIPAAIGLLALAGTYAVPPVIETYSGGFRTATLIRLAVVIACGCVAAIAAALPRSTKRSRWLAGGMICLAAGLAAGWMYHDLLTRRSARFESARIAVGELKPAAEIQQLMDICCSIPGPSPSTNCRTSEGLLWCASGDPMKFYTPDSVQASFQRLTLLYLATSILLALSVALCGSAVWRREPERSPLGVFISYSRRDESYRTALAQRLENFERVGAVESWHDGRITPGADWAKQIETNLRSADVALLLLSPDYLASEYCGLESAMAMERLKAKQTTVVPIIVRECEWQQTPFAKLQVVPRNGKPVSTWTDENACWSHVVDELARMVEQRQREA
jgi:hypothetical protein